MESIKIRKTLLKLDNFGRFFLKIYIHISLALKKVIILNIWKGKIVLQEKDYNVQFEKKTFFVPITGIFAHLSKCNDFSLIKLGRFKYVVWQYECVLCVFLGNGLFFITLMSFCKMYISRHHTIFRSLSFSKVYRISNIKWYHCISESWIDEILPLAGEYEVKCVLLKCENWLLKKAKVTPSYTHEGVDKDVNFLMKCICYGEKYSLKNLYKLCSSKVLSYKLHRYKENEHYQMLPESHKRQLLEDRLLEIETRGKISRQNTAFSTELFECTLSLFL